MKSTVEGNIVDIQQRKIYKGTLEMEKGVITHLRPHPTPAEGFIIPGFIDAHVHIESSMLTPENFGRLVIEHGTVAVVTDPHEIANVMGRTGVEFMLENSRRSPIKTFFTIPSCVPATPFDVSGGVITSADVEQMAASGDYVALSEMMNVPGVLSHDPEVMAKLHSATAHRLPIDGHAPTLTKEGLKHYADQQITTDHECMTLEEAEEKLATGMKILIREGSAARNYEALKSLIATNADEVMFCTDDAHPDDLIERGHIDKLVRRAIADGFDLFDVLKIAALNPIHHYHLEVGQVRVGDKADFIVVDDLETFTVQQVYLNGIKQYDRRTAEREITPSAIQMINHFNHELLPVASLRKAVTAPIPVISLVEGELLTQVYHYTPSLPTDSFESDIKNDILKIVYINRYTNGTPQIAFCKGFRLKRGAFASSISHDSHNIIAVGCNDNELTQAINAVMEQKGGLAVHSDGQTHILPLPIGGIMSDRTGEEVAAAYKELSERIRDMGCRLPAPFMTLSFMSLIVIPEIKIGEKGLFCFTDFNWMS
ncbi:MAG: adenine deaminase [Odoribacter sp.]